MSQPEPLTLPGVMWQVTLTLHGAPQQADLLAEQLQALEVAHGIGLSARYQPEMVELRYWDEGHDCRRVADNALNLWELHRAEIDLPNWVVVGVEILDRGTFQRRWPDGHPQAGLFTPGVAPLT